jgi:dipeptidyl aminopeptidase/acylaminoacyl peptidase
MKKILPIVLAAISQLVSGQAQDQSLKILDQNDYLTWKTIKDVQLSANGLYTSYRVIPGEGDPVLHIYSAGNKTSISIPRVSKSQFDYEADIVFGTITPFRDSLRNLERKKVDKKKWPCDTLFVYHAETGAVEKIPYATGYAAPGKYGGWLAYTLKKEAFLPDSVKEKKLSKKDIVYLIVRNLSTRQQDTFKNIKEYAWADKAPALLAIAQSEDSTEIAGVISWKDHQWKYLKKQKGEYAKLSLAQDGNQIAFIGNLDTTKAQVPPWQLFYSDFKTDSAIAIASKNESTLPLISKDADLRWSENGRYLFYGRAQMPVVKDTTLLVDEIVNVEIWGTEDPELYTMQKVNKANEEKRSYVFAYDTQSKKHTGIGSPAWESTILNNDRNSRFALVYTEKPYEKTVTWLSDGAKDMAVVDLQTGKTTSFRDSIFTNPRLSPDGKFAFGFSDMDSTWWTYQIVTGVFTLMNRSGLPRFYDEQNDTPGFPGNYGFAGWTTDDQSLIVYDRYDIWSWSPMKGKTPVRLTQGRESQMIYRYVRTDAEERSLSMTTPWLLQGTDDVEKGSGYVWYSPVDNSVDRIHVEPFQFSKQVSKSRKADVYVYTKENFQVFPDLRRSTDRLVNSEQISDANPQQKEYRWGTIELYHWMDWDSVMRTGMLVKPAGYDTLHSYPTIVNFYERSSNDLNVHPTIAPHRSTINYAFYASRGYVIFNPDITYALGRPGESAYEIVLSGVTTLVKQRISDPNNLALQGHSWGGYQIAYILTRTNMFKCAEAGAAVVNMTSAYGGIRGESGRARMFQYENEQSRIGKTLWEDPQSYIINSPLFKVDKIKTPLLLLHNDEDGAVPFQQGIEFYLALRRNGKQAWLLNYHGEPHWPVKWENRKDFQLRMSQFFDYYLMDKKEPEWMAKSVPVVKWVK